MAILVESIRYQFLMVLMISLSTGLGDRPLLVGAMEPTPSGSGDESSNSSTTGGSSNTEPTTYSESNTENLATTATINESDPVTSLPGSMTSSLPVVPPPSLLRSLAARLATRSCVRFGRQSGISSSLLSSQLTAFCPTYVNRYLEAEGVSLLSIEDKQNASGLERLIATGTFYQQTFGEQLDYYNGPARPKLLHGLAEVQWDGSTVEDMEKRVDLLTCTSLYPPCETIDGRLLALQACDWFCEDLREALLPLAEALATDRSALVSSGYYALLYSTSHSCIRDGVSTSTNPLAQATAASASPPRCQNCTKTACKTTEVTVMQPGSAKSFSPPGRLCFNTSTLRPCPAPFISTPVSKHWDRTVQANFRGVVDVARGMLRVNDTFVITNGSFLPCTFDCHDTLFFTHSERNSMVLALGLIGLFVFLIGIFALASFILNWDRLNKYPQRIIFIVNVNVFCSVFGLCGHYLTSDPDSFLCNKDGSVRIDTPDGTSGGTGCAILFSILYFFSMASVAWWVCLSHAWYVTLPCITRPDFGRMRNGKFEKWYHLFTWPPVAILTIIQLATRDVGGVYFYGICWMDNDLARFGYLVIPLAVASAFGTVFLLLGIRSFYQSRHTWRVSTIKVNTSGDHSKLDKKDKKLSKVEVAMRSFLVRLWVLLLAVLVHMIVQIIVGSIRRAKWEEWTQITRTRLSCLLTTCNDTASCPPLPDVSVVLLAIPPAASGTYALCTYIWAFNEDNFRLWGRFGRRWLRRLLCREDDGSYGMVSRSMTIVNSGAMYTSNGNAPQLSLSEND